MAKFNLIGLYQIAPTLESLVVAAKFHRYDWLVTSSDEFKDEIRWDEFINLGLFEFQVYGEYLPTDLSNIHQDDQSPYLEFHLDPAGVLDINDGDAIKTDGRRVCFFLHFIDISMPLLVGEQKIKLPIMSKLPDRLIPFTHYVPVD